MAQRSARDICDARVQLYRKGRDDHLASSVAPGGQTHEVDVLKLLCLSECVDYGLASARVSGTGGVVMTEPARPGDIVTFFPGDSVMFWPALATDVSMRITSDRVRDRVGEYHAISHTIDIGDGFRIAGHPDFSDDANYVGHLVRRGDAETANCQVDYCEGIAVALVATKHISSGDDLLLG